MPIIRRNNCIYATLGICRSVWKTVCYAGWNETGFISTLSSTQSDKYEMSHRYSYFSRLWTHSRPKHVEKLNKHTKKNCAPSWLYLHDYIGMHGQQNIKFSYRRQLSYTPVLKGEKKRHSLHGRELGAACVPFIPLIEQPVTLFCGDV